MVIAPRRALSAAVQDPADTSIRSASDRLSMLLGWPLGIMLAWTLAHWRGMNYWLLAFAFGLVVPTLVGWFVVPLIKGTPIMGGPPWMIQAVRPLPNAIWAIGTAWLLTYLPANFIWHR
jgi:hypothetical protein